MIDYTSVHVPSQDKTYYEAMVWDTKTGAELWSRKKPTVNTVLFFSDGKRMLLASDDAFSIVAVRTGEELQSFPVSEATPDQFDPTETYLLYSAEINTEGNKVRKLRKMNLSDGTSTDEGITPSTRFTTRFVEDRVQVVGIESKTVPNTRRSTTQLSIRFTDETSPFAEVVIPDYINSVDFAHNNPSEIIAHTWREHFIVNFENPKAVKVRRTNFFEPNGHSVKVISFPFCRLQGDSYYI